MDRRLARKLTSLRKRIRQLDSALVAFSGGVDSTFLTRICRDELGDKAVAVTALAENYPRSELSMARRVAKIVGVKHMVLNATPEGEDVQPPAGFRGVRGKNVYSTLKSLAMRMKLKHVLDGSHLDDASEKGDSFQAARQAGVTSPLLESGLSKAEIRLLAKELGLPNWDKAPSSEKKRSRRAAGRSPAAGSVQKAREYLMSISAGANLLVKGSKAFILADRAATVKLAKRLGAIRRKMRLLGFSEVLLEISA